MTTKDDEVALNNGGASAKPEGAPDAEGWLRFLEKEVDATRDVFLTKPKLLLGHVRSERQTADDYAGRELLELVQNAADAAAEMGGGGRVRIEIDAQGLIVANTGHPFRTGGVESLMTPNASDKPGRKVTLIGAKGLGFRSLLNWSHEPVISSGALEIGFSRAHAEAMIASLAVESDQIATLVQAEDDPPVPVLAFPAFGDALSAIHSAADRSLVGRARNLRALGYDTVVAAPFDDERAMGRAVRQAGEFEPTFLLFVESLEEIELKIADQPLVRWSRTPVGDDAYRIVADVGGIVTEQSWICMRRRGELVVRGRRKPRVYELSVALRTDESNRPGVLHSYFPTSIPLPFPALLHATLELDSNRKAIKEDSDLNEGVLTELGAFYVDTLARLSRLKRVTNPLDYLTRTGTFPQPLRAFEAEVYRAARPLKIIPTIRGGRVSGAVGRVGPVGYETYLPARLFGDLIRCRGAEDRAVLERLDVECLSGLVTVWFRSPVSHYATLASKAKGLIPPRYEWRLRAL